MNDISVISGNACRGLADGIAGRMGANRVVSDIRVFPDGESKITLSGDIAGRSIVVQSMPPPVDTNLVCALSLIYRAREASSRVTAVVPYMGYARQDREFMPGEIVTMKVIGRLLEGAGATDVIVVDIHSMAGLEHFGIAARNVTAVPCLAGHFAGMRLRDPLVVSPDQGGRRRAEEFAGMMRTECIALSKRRDRTTGDVEIRTDRVDGISGRDMILVDDMISTGGSIVKAAQFLRGCGCGRIYAACTHALLVGGAEQRIMDAGVTGIVSTNTVPGRTSAVDVSGLLADAIGGM